MLVQALGQGVKNSGRRILEALIRGINADIVRLGKLIEGIAAIVYVSILLETTSKLY